MISYLGKNNYYYMEIDLSLHWRLKISDKHGTLHRFSELIDFLANRSVHEFEA